MGFGGGSPKVQTQAPEKLDEEKNKLKKQRVAIFATEGENAGEEVSIVGRRQRLFGN